MMHIIITNIDDRHNYTELVVDQGDMLDLLNSEYCHHHIAVETHLHLVILADSFCVCLAPLAQAPPVAPVALDFCCCIAPILHAAPF